MKKTTFVLLVFVLIFVFGCEEALYHVVETEGMDSVVIDASNRQAKLKMRFDIYKVGENLIEIPVARIAITRTTPTYSIGTIILRNDGSSVKPSIAKISRGMLCRKTTKATLKAEKKIYKYQKKSLKRQYKLSKLKGKSGVYDSLARVAQDTNEIDSIETGFFKMKVDKKE